MWEEEMQTEILRQRQLFLLKISEIPPPTGESDKYDLQGPGRTKHLEQFGVYIILSTN